MTNDDPITVHVSPEEYARLAVNFASRLDDLSRAGVGLAIGLGPLPVEIENDIESAQLIAEWWRRFNAKTECMTIDQEIEIQADFKARITKAVLCKLGIAAPPPLIIRDRTPTS